MTTRGDKKVNVSLEVKPTLKDSFRARQLAIVMQILKRPSPVENEIYEGE
jgi:hypothetical protein